MVHHSAWPFNVLDRPQTSADVSSVQSHLASIGDKSLILVDALCLHCNQWVRFVLDHDERATFVFSSMQSLVGRELLRQCGGKYSLPRATSLVLIDSAGFYTDSTAALRIVSLLSPSGAVGRVRAALWGAAAAVVPRPLRDTIYASAADKRIEAALDQRTDHSKCRSRYTDPSHESRFLDFEDVRSDGCESLMTREQQIYRSFEKARAQTKKAQHAVKAEYWADRSQWIGADGTVQGGDGVPINYQPPLATSAGSESVPDLHPPSPPHLIDMADYIRMRNAATPPMPPPRPDPSVSGWRDKRPPSPPPPERALDLEEPAVEGGTTFKEPPVLDPPEFDEIPLTPEEETQANTTKTKTTHTHAHSHTLFPPMTSPCICHTPVPPLIAPLRWFRRFCTFSGSGADAVLGRRK